MWYSVNLYQLDIYNRSNTRGKKAYSFIINTYIHWTQDALTITDVTIMGLVKVDYVLYKQLPIILVMIIMI